MLCYTVHLCRAECLQSICIIGKFYVYDALALTSFFFQILGPVFGNKDYFVGLAVIADTYSNHNGPHNVSTVN